MRGTAPTVLLAAWFGACATAQQPPARAGDGDALRPAPRLAWETRSRSIRCPGGAAVSVPEELANDVRPDGMDGLAIVAPGPGARGALVATTRAPASPRASTSPAGRLPGTWARLHKLASGKEPGAVHANMRIDGPFFIADYTENDAPELQWRFIYADAGRCWIAALDQVRPDAPPVFTALVSGMYIPPSFLHAP